MREVWTRRSISVDVYTPSPSQDTFPHPIATSPQNIRLSRCPETGAWSFKAPGALHSSLVIPQTEAIQATQISPTAEAVAAEISVATPGVPAATPLISPILPPPSLGLIQQLMGDTVTATTLPSGSAPVTSKPTTAPLASGAPVNHLSKAVNDLSQVTMVTCCVTCTLVLVLVGWVEGG